MVSSLNCYIFQSNDTTFYFHERLQLTVLLPFASQLQHLLVTPTIWNYLSSRSFLSVTIVIHFPLLWMRGGHFLHCTTRLSPKTCTSVLHIFALPAVNGPLPAELKFWENNAWVYGHCRRYHYTYRTASTSWKKIVKWIFYFITQSRMASCIRIVWFQKVSIPPPPHGRSLEIPRGRGGSKAVISEG